MELPPDSGRMKRLGVSAFRRVSGNILLATRSRRSREETVAMAKKKKPKHSTNFFTTP